MHSCVWRSFTIGSTCFAVEYILVYSSHHRNRGLVSLFSNILGLPETRAGIICFYNVGFKGSVDTYYFGSGFYVCVGVCMCVTVGQCGCEQDISRTERARDFKFVIEVNSA
uniref:Uncharacterized protein n=1 Tax=Cacopsylla melanoneura TaxID=428564 RepID=A0A8D9E598_9HEMI